MLSMSLWADLPLLFEQGRPSPLSRYPHPGGRRQGIPCAGHAPRTPAGFGGAPFPPAGGVSGGYTGLSVKGQTGKTALAFTSKYATIGTGCPAHFRAKKERMEEQYEKDSLRAAGLRAVHDSPGRVQQVRSL